LWKVRTPRGLGEELIVEVSFKAKDEKNAGIEQEKLHRFVEENGWLTADVLKTDLILRRY
jgi:hypothetical protein